MVNGPISSYLPGKRMDRWLKFKAALDALDLLLGAAWGERRMTRFLSSYLLACRNLETGRFLEVERVSTGQTDKDLAGLTELSEDPIIGRNA